MNSDWTCTTGMRLYYLSCPQHFHNHHFNEVNLFKMVDKGITTFFLLICLCFNQCAPSPLQFSLSLEGVGRGEEVFFISTRSLLLSSPLSPGSCALHPNQTAWVVFKPPHPHAFLRHKDKSNKGLRRRGNERETAKGKRWQWWLEGWWRRLYKLGWGWWWWWGGGSKQDRNSKSSKGDGWRKWERQKERGAD